MLLKFGIYLQSGPKIKNNGNKNDINEKITNKQTKKQLRLVLTNSTLKYNKCNYISIKTKKPFIELIVN